MNTSRTYKNFSCPRCGRGFIRRISQPGWVGQVSRLIHRQTFCCQVCTLRFGIFRVGPRHSTHRLDQRQFRRLSTEIPPVVHRTPFGQSDTVTELTMSGCTIRTNSPLTEGTFLTLHLRCSEGEEPIEVETVMVRSTRPNFVGVEFLEFQPGEQARLSEFILSLFAGESLASEAGL